MFDFILGLGQGGGRIAKEFSDGFDIDAAYMNLTSIDFSKFNVPRNRVFIFEVGGTGRDPKMGEQTVRKQMFDVKAFLDYIPAFDNSKFVLVCVGGGGGSGTGFMFPLIDYIVKKRKKEVLLILTLPEKREGLPVKPNALVTLNRIIENYLQRSSETKISILPIDNDFCIKKYGIGGNGYDYWKRVNIGLVKSLKRFWMMTNLEKYKNYVDMSSGYKSIDRNDVLRVLSSKHGFLDIREMLFDSLDTDSALKKVKTASLVFGSLDIGTTKRYIISVGVPDSWKEKKGVLNFIESIFQIVAKSTKNTPDVVRCSYFNKKLQRVHVHLLLSGLSKSHGLEKLINSTRKDVIQIQAKGDIEKLDLTGINC